MIRAIPASDVYWYVHFATTGLEEYYTAADLSDPSWSSDADDDDPDRCWRGATRDWLTDEEGVLL